MVPRPIQTFQMTSPPFLDLQEDLPMRTEPLRRSPDPPQISGQFLRPVLDLPEGPPTSSGPP